MTHPSGRPAFHECIFEGTTVVLVGRYTNCTFRRCTVIYNGGELDLRTNIMDHCEVVFVGPAARTLSLLVGLYRDSTGGREFVVATLQGLFGGDWTPPPTPDPPEAP